MAFSDDERRHTGKAQRHRIGGRAGIASAAALGAGSMTRAVVDAAGEGAPVRLPDWGSAGESVTLPPNRIGGGMSAAAVRTGRTIGDAGVTPSSQSF